MARYSYPPLDNLPEHLAREIRARVVPGRGNVWRMLMWTPQTAGPFVDLSEAVRHRTLLPPEIRELIILRVAYLCDAAYEIHHHKIIGREVGMTEDAITAASKGSTALGIDALERLALDLTDDLVKNHHLSNETFAKAIDKFGIRTVADVVLLVGFYIMASLFLKTFEIDIEKT